MQVKSLTAFLLLAISAASAVFAADSPLTPDGEVRLHADKLTHEQKGDVIQATGNVELNWGGSKLYSDVATYFGEQGVVNARGKVRLLKDGDILSGDSAEFDVNSRNGRVENGYMFMKKNNLHLRGAQIEKSGEQDYRMQSGSLTSCDGDNPGWKFVVDDLRVTMDDFATGRNVFFYLGDTPVFWLPYIIFPAKVERQSGFLLPKLGNSSKKGVFLDIPYYWAISPSRDATFDLDLQSKRGVGLGAEYRYLGTDGGHGYNHGYLIYDTRQDRFRGDLGLKQQLNFSMETYWRADVNLTLDRDFYRDYGLFSGEYNKQYLESTAFLSRQSNDLLFTAGVDYLDNLDLPSNAVTLQQLPFLTFMGTGSKIGAAPVYYSFDSGFAHFDRDQGGRGERFYLFPQMSVNTPLGDAVSGRIWTGYKERLYHAVDALESEGWHGSGAVEGGASLQTELGRTFAFSVGDVNSLRHTIIPELSYEFKERKSPEGLPFFDYDDRPVAGQLLTASIYNVLTAKSLHGGKVDYRDLLRLSLTQGYQLSGDRRDLLVLVDDGRVFADTRLKAELLPIPQISIRSDLRVSPYSGNLNNAFIGVEGGEAKGSRLGLSWYHARERLDYIEGRVTIADLQPFTMSAAGRYSFDRPGFLETLYSFEYRHQCWSFNLTYRDRPDNSELTFNFTLAGLGVIGPLKAF